MQRRMPVGRIGLVGLIGTIACLTMGNPVFGAAPPLTGPLPPGRLDPNDVIVNKHPPVPFQPFKRIDPKTRKQVAPDAIITLPSGKQVPAGAYYDELNRLEQGFNQLGYSFRDQPNRPEGQRKRIVQLQRHRMDPQVFQQQQDYLRRDHVIAPTQAVPVPLEQIPQLNQAFQQQLQAAQAVQMQAVQMQALQMQAVQINPRSVESPPPAEEIDAFRKHQAQALKDQLLAERLEADRAFGIETGDTEIQEATKDIDEQMKQLDSQQVTPRGLGLSEEDQEDFAQWRLVRHQLEQAEPGSEKRSAGDDVTSRAIMKVNPALRDATIFSQAREIHKNKGVNWSGGNDWFGAFVRGTTTLDAYATRVMTHADFAVGGTVIGSSFSLLDTDSTITTPMSGPMTALVRLSVVGTTIVNINKSQSTTWGATSGPSRAFNKSTPTLTIWLGPVPLSVKAGIRGSSGMDYTVGFQPVRAYVSVGPNLNVEGYAQAAVGADLILVEAYAGARGVVTLVKERFVAQADAALKRNIYGTWVFEVVFAVYNDIRMLDGRVELFATIRRPCIPDVWNECEDEWTDPIFEWGGIHAIGYLVNERATMNVYGAPANQVMMQ